MLVQVNAAVIGLWLGWLIGGFDGLVTALVIFVITDYITGVTRAVAEKRLSSSVCFKGLLKKALIFALVGVSHTLDKYVIGEGSLTRTATIFFYLTCEGISILENIKALGVPMPSKLHETLNNIVGVKHADK